MVIQRFNVVLRRTGLPVRRKYRKIRTENQEERGEKMRLLLAEDERDLCRALEAIFRHNNYSIDVVRNGNDALDYASSQPYDGIILDVMMPGMNGFDVLEKLRASGVDTPVLMLTARTQTSDKVEGLDRGADDYLTKPFEIEELLARVRALTRRRSEYSHSVLKCGNLSLNKATFELIGPDGASFRLANREFQLMELLMANKGLVLSTEQLMQRIWGCAADAEINVVWVNISNLRKKMAHLNANIEIRANRGIGYSLEEKI